MKKTIAAMGLLALAFTGAAEAQHQDSSTNNLRADTLNIAQGTIDFAFDADAKRHPFLIQSKRALTGMVNRLEDANAAERAQIHKEAYNLRLTLERRNFAYHYAMAAQTVAMAASGNGDWETLDKTESALYATAIYDLGRITRADLRRPMDSLLAEAAEKNVKARCSGKWCLLDALNDHDIAKAVDTVRSNTREPKP
jgi:hypothetical protein